MAAAKNSSPLCVTTFHCCHVPGASLQLLLCCDRTPTSSPPTFLFTVRTLSLSATPWKVDRVCLDLSPIPWCRLVPDPVPRLVPQAVRTGYACASPTMHIYIWDLKLLVSRAGGAESLVSTCTHLFTQQLKILWNSGEGKNNCPGRRGLWKVVLQSNQE